MKKIKQSFILTILFISSTFSLGQEKSSYVIGFSKEIFEEVNVRDAKATLDVWGKLLIKGFKDVDGFNTIVYSNNEDLITGSKNNEFDVLYISALNYLENENELNVEPEITTNHYKSKFYDLILCSNNSKKNIKFSDIKNSSIIIQGGKYRNIAELWFDVLCLENGVKNKYDFFKSIEFADKPMQAVFPVYLKKTDYCIVNSVSLSAISELNPQIARGLNPIFKKEKLVNDLICINNSLPASKKKFLKEIILNFDNLPESDQFFKIFKSVGYNNYSPELLDGLRSMLKETSIGNK